MMQSNFGTKLPFERASKEGADVANKASNPVMSSKDYRGTFPEWTEGKVFGAISTFSRHLDVLVVTWL